MDQDDELMNQLIYTLGALSIATISTSVVCCSKGIYPCWNGKKKKTPPLLQSEIMVFEGTESKVAQQGFITEKDALDLEDTERTVAHPPDSLTLLDITLRYLIQAFIINEDLYYNELLFDALNRKEKQIKPVLTNFLLGTNIFRADFTGKIWLDVFHDTMQEHASAMGLKKASEFMSAVYQGKTWDWYQSLLASFQEHNQLLKAKILHNTLHFLYIFNKKSTSYGFDLKARYQQYFYSMFELTEQSNKLNKYFPKMLEQLLDNEHFANPYDKVYPDSAKLKV